jgi:ABC-2 type transport system ATP-binding protein
MARRAGLAQALVNDPDLLLLDEPTAGLDPIGCREVKDLMLDLAGRGKTIVLSSHLLADVEDVCGRIAILHDGCLRAHGRVEDLLRKSDRSRIVSPALPPEALGRVVETIRQATGETPRVDHPSMNLEQFFLDVVGEADRAAGGGAGPGGPGGGGADDVAAR